MNELDHKFRSLLFEWIEELRKRGLCINIRDTYISPFEQAKLWKSGHSDSDIDQVIESLKVQGCHYIAELIIDAKASIGPFVTNLLPGCSWHNWRTAMTYDLQKIGEDQKLSVHNPEFRTAVRWAKKIGLFTGENLEPVQLKPTLIQLNSQTHPTDCFSLKEIDNKLKECYDDQPN